ncbi:MAG: hypothetical protein MZU97_06570 [Bacillus subtilis]|nr:hypothetical protein [Bacillus subtilis]
MDSIERMQSVADFLVLYYFPLTRISYKIIGRKDLQRQVCTNPPRIHVVRDFENTSEHNVLILAGLCTGRSGRILPDSKESGKPVSKDLLGRDG